jgi:hypothetical protein
MLDQSLVATLTGTNLKKNMGNKGDMQALGPGTW